MKIKFNSDGNLLLKTLELYNLIIAVKSVFHDDNKYYPQVFLVEFVYKLEIFEYDRIDVFESIDFKKNNGSRKCIICHYWYFLQTNFRF